VPSGPFEVQVDPSRLDAGLVDELKAVLEHHKGDAEVHLVLETSEGPKSLRLGDGYRVRPSSGLLAEIDHVLGQAALAA
jgi:DNA polymerase-3 subunit alpha